MANEEFEFEHIEPEDALEPFLRQQLEELRDTLPPGPASYIQPWAKGVRDRMARNRRVALGYSENAERLLVKALPARLRPLTEDAEALALAKAQHPELGEAADAGRINGNTWFRGRNHRLGGANSLRIAPFVTAADVNAGDLAKAIYAAAQHMRVAERAVHTTARIAYQANGEGQREFRSLVITPALSPLDILNAIIQYTPGGPVQHGSDVDMEYDTLDCQWFDMLWLEHQRPGRGGPRASYSTQESARFVGISTQQKSSKIANCLVAAFRTLAISEVERGRLAETPAFIKTDRELMMEHAPDRLRSGLLPEDGDWLAKAFGVSVRIIADELDNEVVFKDTARSNSATVVQHPRILRTCIANERPVPVDFVFSGSSRPLVGIALYKGHYFIAEAMKPAFYHPVTGDELVEGVELDADDVAARVEAQGRKLAGAAKRERARRAKPAAKPRRPRRLLIYDFETVWDAVTGELAPYAVSWAVVDPDAGRIADQMRGPSPPVVKTKLAGPDMPPGVMAFAGEILDELKRAPEDVDYICCAYNGSRFDHLLLLRAAASREWLNSRGFVWHNSSVLSARIGRHSVHDLNRFTPGTLKGNCDAFKTNPKKVDGFDHAEVQKAYLAGGLNAWIAANEAKLREYVGGDVLCLADLYVVAREAIQRLTGRDVLDFATIGALGYDGLKESAEPAGCLKGADTRERDRWLRRAMTGGRVQVLANEGRPFEAYGDFAMVDFKSLYPTMCMNRDFPCGEPRETAAGEYEAETAAGRLGMYNVHIIDQPAIPVLPLREEGRPLNWFYRGEMDAVATTVDIENVKAKGGHVTVGSGYVWPDKTRGIFRAFFDRLAGEKNRQDALKKAGAADYNPAAREVCKLVMNAITGKLGQRDREGMETVICRGRAALDELLAALDEASVEMVPLAGESVLVTGRLKDAKEWHAQFAHPAHLTCFIYSYARAMFYLLAEAGGLYGDTDSALLSREDYERMRVEHPELFPAPGEDARFGHVEEEILGSRAKAATRHHVLVVMPKTYAVFSETDAGDIVQAQKVKCKGLGKKDALLDAEEFAALKTGDGLRIAARFAAAETDGRRRFGSPEAARGILSDLVHGGVAYALCSQIRRSLVVAGEKDDAGRGPVFILREAFVPKMFAASPAARKQADDRLAEKRKAAGLAPLLPEIVNGEPAARDAADGEPAALDAADGAA